MKFHTVIIFLILIFATKIDANINFFRGKKLTYQGDTPLEVRISGTSDATTLNGDVILLSAESVKVHVEKPNPNLVYFKVDGDNKVYALSFKKFTSLLKKGDFGKWEKKKYDYATVHAKLAKDYGKNIPSSGWIKTDQGIMKEGVKIEFIPPKVAKQLGAATDKVYFYQFPKGSDKPDKSQIFTMDPIEFENSVESGLFGNWYANRYRKNGPKAPQKPTPKPTSRPKPTPEVSQKTKKKPVSTSTPEVLQTNVYYTLKPGAPTFKVTMRHNGEEDTLAPGEQFYIVEDNYSDTNYLYAVKRDFSARLRIEDDAKFINAFLQGKVKKGNAVDFSEFAEYSTPMAKENARKAKAQASKKAPTRTGDIDPKTYDNTPYRSTPSLKGTVATVNESQEFIEDGNKQIDYECYNKLKTATCNPDNDYVQRILTNKDLGLLSEEDLRSNNLGKHCIKASLDRATSFKFAATCTKNEDTGKIKVTGAQTCKSNEYISFINKEMRQMADCFTNISFEELLPLINIESKFNYNAYNTNRNGSLNASGILQATDVLYEDVNPKYKWVDGKLKRVESPKAYLVNNAKKVYQMKLDTSSAYCAAIFKEIKEDPPSRERNACTRTGIPKGFRSNLYLTMANYSHAKQEIEKKLTQYEKNYGNVSLFDERERKAILVDMARLAHNRGIGVFKKRFASFFYDLFHGKFGQDTQTVKGQRHGNAAIWKLWGRPNFKAPLNHNEFTNFFSSYIFWEGDYNRGFRRGSGGVKRTPDMDRHDFEGGAFLHKLACDQEIMNRKAKRSSGAKSVNCGYPAIDPKKLEKTQVEVGWYYNVCKQQNKSQSSRRVCSAKDPYNAKNADGTRRLTDSKIEEYTGDEKWLDKCDFETLRGLAARPLLEFYVKTPKEYE